MTAERGENPIASRMTDWVCQQIGIRKRRNETEALGCLPLIWSSVYPACKGITWYYRMSLN